jgi:hypothetical protein
MQVTSELILKLGRAFELLAERVSVHTVQRGVAPQLCAALETGGHDVLRSHASGLAAEVSERMRLLASMDTLEALVRELGNLTASCAEAKGAARDEAIDGMRRDGDALRQERDALRAKADEMQRERDALCARVRAAEERVQRLEADARDREREHARALARVQETAQRATDRRLEALRTEHESVLLKCAAHGSRGQATETEHALRSAREQLLAMGAIALRCLGSWIEQVETNGALGRILVSTADALHVAQSRNAHLMTRAAAVFECMRTESGTEYLGDDPHRLFKDVFDSDCVSEWTDTTVCMSRIAGDAETLASVMWGREPGDMIDIRPRLRFASSDLGALSSFCVLMGVDNDALRTKEAVVPTATVASLREALSGQISDALTDLAQLLDSNPYALLPNLPLIMHSSLRLHHNLDAVTFATTAGRAEALETMLAQVVANVGMAVVDESIFHDSRAMLYLRGIKGEPGRRRYSQFRFGLSARKSAVCWFPLAYVSFHSVALIAAYVAALPELGMHVRGRHVHVNAAGDFESMENEEPLSIPFAFVRAVGTEVRRSGEQAAACAPMRSGKHVHAVQWVSHVDHPRGDRGELLRRALANYAYLGNPVAPVWCGAMGALAHSITPHQLNAASKKLASDANRFDSTQMIRSVHASSA